MYSDTSVRRQLALGRGVAAKVRADPDRLLVLGRRNLRRLRLRPGNERATRWLDEWERLLDAGPDAVAELLEQASDYGHDMRQMSPFAGALSNTERWAILREVYRAVA